MRERREVLRTGERDEGREREVEAERDRDLQRRLRCGNEGGGTSSGTSYYAMRVPIRV